MSIPTPRARRHRRDDERDLSEGKYSRQAAPRPKGRGELRLVATVRPPLPYCRPSFTAGEPDVVGLSRG